jgi:ABC-type multidrug transport system fused ATPase/permease subunit
MIRRWRALRSGWRALHGYLDGKWGVTAIMAVASLLSGFAEAGVLFLVVQAALGLAAGDEQLRLDVPLLPDGVVPFNTSLLIAGGLLLAVAGLAVVQSLATASISTSSLNLARKRAFEAFIRANWRLQSSQEEGHLQQVLTAHVARVGTWALRLAGAISALLSLIAYLASAFLLEPAAAAAVFVGLGLVSLVLIPLTRLSKRLSRYAARLGKSYARLLAQSIRMTREVKVFDVGETVLQQVEQKADQVERVAFRSRFLGQVTPKVYQYAALSLVIAGLAIVRSTSDGDLSDIGAVILLLVRSLSYGQQLSSNIQGLSDNEPYVTSVAEMQAMFREGREDRDGSSLPDRISLTLEDASYSYTPGNIVLHGLRLHIEPFEAVGIVGPTGSGKSTLANLLLRLVEPQGGRYLVNGVDASTFSRASWAEAFAFVPQENVLFQGSIADNIRFFRDGVSIEQVERAAHLARLSADLAAFPDGLDTQVGVGIRDLSGGQRQRLGIARALVGSPTVLLMDEPTSALDMESEDLIRRTLQDLRETTTLIIIAHRPSTLSLCDRIVVLKDGAIVADGPPGDVERDNSFFERSLSFARGDAEADPA